MDNAYPISVNRGEAIPLANFSALQNGKMDWVTTGDYWEPVWIEELVTLDRIRDAVLPLVGIVGLRAEGLEVRFFAEGTYSRFYVIKGMKEDDEEDAEARHGEVGLQVAVRALEQAVRGDTSTSATSAPASFITQSSAHLFPSPTFSDEHQTDTPQLLPPPAFLSESQTSTNPGATAPRSSAILGRVQTRHDITSATKPDNQAEYLFKINLPVFPYYMTTSEAATLTYIRRFTNITVPRCHAYDASGGLNQLGYEWLLLDLLPGVPLSSVESDLPAGRRIELARKLADWNSEFEDIPPWRGEGSLYFTTTPPGFGGGPTFAQQQNERLFFHPGPRIPPYIPPPDELDVLPMNNETTHLFHRDMTSAKVLIDPSTALPTGLIGLDRTPLDQMSNIDFYPPLMHDPMGDLSGLPPWPSSVPAPPALAGLLPPGSEAQMPNPKTQLRLREEERVIKTLMRHAYRKRVVDLRARRKRDEEREMEEAVRGELERGLDARGGRDEEVGEGEEESLEEGEIGEEMEVDLEEGNTGLRQEAERRVTSPLFREWSSTES